MDTPSGYKYRFRDPYTIGYELKQYLDCPDRKVPFDVFEDKTNNIVEFIRNH